VGPKSFLAGVNLVTPTPRAKHELLFNKPASGTREKMFNDVDTRMRTEFKADLDKLKKKLRKGGSSAPKKHHHQEEDDHHWGSR
jgi:hypothetical protein